MRKFLALLFALIISTTAAQAQWTSSGFSLGGGGGAAVTAGTITGANDLLGTASQITVTSGTGVLVGSGDATLSLPQNIATTSTPTFGEITVTGEVVADSTGVTFLRNLYNGGVGGVGALGNWLTGGQFATSVDADNCPMVLYGYTGGSANLQEWNLAGGSGGNACKVTANGGITSAGLGTFATLSSGAGGFTSDADGDTVAKTLDLTGGTMSVADGGTGSATGAGLFGGYGTATDTVGPITLTASSPRFRYVSNGSTAITYVLPDAATCPNAVIWWQGTTDAGSGDITLSPFDSNQRIGGRNLGSNYVISATLNDRMSWALQSTGQTGWSWIQYPQNLDPIAGNGFLAFNTTGQISRGTNLAVTLGGTGLTSLPSANQVLGVNSGGTDYEGKTLTEGSGITITHGAGDITIAASYAANSLAGQGTLVNGVATISTTAIDADDVVHITRTGGTLTTAGVLWEVKASRSAGTSFVVNSYYPVTAGGTTASATDDATFDWVIQKVD